MTSVEINLAGRSRHSPLAGPRTLGSADFVDNRQYLTLGNLQENPKAHLFLINYVNRKCVRIWGGQGGAARFLQRLSLPDTEVDGKFWR